MAGPERCLRQGEPVNLTLCVRQGHEVLRPVAPLEISVWPEPQVRTLVPVVLVLHCYTRIIPKQVRLFVRHTDVLPVYRYYASRP